MNYAIRITAPLLLSIAVWNPLHDEPHKNSKFLTWNDVKHYLSYYESSNGKFKFNKNRNGTIDCGIYQINSRHFTVPRKTKDSVAVVFDGIFHKYGVSKKVSERITENIRNDQLNEELARTLYEIKGIKQWVAYPKFKKYLEGYIYNQ